MKKGKSSRSKAPPASDEFDSESEGESQMNPLSNALSDIMDRKPALRAKGFDSIAEYLSSHVADSEFLEGFCETLGTYGAKALERGTPAEIAAATRACELYAVSVGACDNFYKLVAPPCLKVFSMNNSTSGSGTRHLLVRLLSVLSFFCSEDPSDVLSLVGLLKSFLLDVSKKKKPPVPLLLETVRAWNLVVTTAYSSLTEENTRPLARVFMDYVSAGETDSELKIECLYGLALLFEGFAGSSSGSGDDESGTLTVADYPEWLDSEELEDASRESALRASKRDKAGEQRVFRAVCGYLLEGTQPSATMLKVMRHKLEFANWDGVYRIGAVSRVLGGHLNLHLASSAVLMDVFGYSMETSGDGDKSGGRRERNPEKAKMMNIKRARDRDFKASSLAWDGGDADDDY